MQVVPLQYLGMQLILAIYMAKYHTLKQRIQCQSMCFKKKKKKRGEGEGGKKTRHYTYDSDINVVTLSRFEGTLIKFKYLFFEL